MFPALLPRSRTFPWRLLALLFAAVLFALLLALLAVQPLQAQPNTGCVWYWDPTFPEGHPGTLICPTIDASVTSTAEFVLGQHTTLLITLDGGFEAFVQAAPPPPVVHMQLPWPLQYLDMQGSDDGWSEPTVVTDTYSFTFFGEIIRDQPVSLSVNLAALMTGPVTATTVATITGAPEPSVHRTPLVVQPVTPDDADGDGLANRIECEAQPCPDTDSDRIPDMMDLDSDGDNVPDRLEHGGPAPADAAAAQPLLRDTDVDGLPDFRDPDDDGDGVPTAVECPAGPPCPAQGMPLLPDYLNRLYPTADGAPLRLIYVPGICAETVAAEGTSTLGEP